MSLLLTTLILCLAALAATKEDDNAVYELKLGRTDNDAKWRGRLEIRMDEGAWGSVCYDRGERETTFLLEFHSQQVILFQKVVYAALNSSLRENI